jgi:hypothetical protein
MDQYPLLAMDEGVYETKETPKGHCGTQMVVGDRGVEEIRGSERVAIEGEETRTASVVIERPVIQEANDGLDLFGAYRLEPLRDDRHSVDAFCRVSCSGGAKD